MKRLNLSFYNDTTSDPVLKDALLRVTFTTPQNLSGNLRTTRFKITKGAFPLFFLGPDDRLFTSEEKGEIDAYEMTPTGLAWGFIMHNTNTLPCGVDTYLLDATSPPRPCVPVGGNITPFHTVYNHVYLTEKPRWKKVGSRWQLVNDELPVFDWNFLTESDSAFYLHRYSDVTCQDCVKPASHGVEFSLIFKDMDPGDVTTPVHFMSYKLYSTIKNNNDYSSSFQFKQVILDEISDPWLKLNTAMLVTSGKITYSKQVEGIIASGSLVPESKDLSSTVYYDYELGTGNLLFPYTAIIVTIDELNFLGESIVVNDKDLTGVISPSVLSTFKTYLVSMDGSEKSDFFRVDDTLTQAPLRVEAPAVSTLTVRLFMLTKQNRLFAMKIPAGEGFFIQISVE